MMKWFLWLALSFGVLGAAQGAALPDFTQLVTKATPSVVNITTIVDGKAQPQAQIPDDMRQFFRHFGIPDSAMPGYGRSLPMRGEGSGFIISPDGYILTNAHVVADADVVTVKLSDRREFRAKVIGSDSATDVALIKIDAKNLPQVSIGDPSKLKVGEWVLAVGEPFGFENSVTAGIVSAKGRALPQDNFVPFIQTDAAVNPGNSGGPLFNMDGQVVGINSQIVSKSGGFMGLSFAIPIDVAMNVVDQIKAHGKVIHGRLGVVIQDVSADLAESFGLKQPNGALVSEVEPNSPAAKAGLKVSDIILQYDGKPIVTSFDLPRLVGATKPGSEVPVAVWRKGEMKTLTVKVGELKESNLADAGAAKPDTAGLAVSPLSPEQKKQLGINSGLLVEDVRGSAARAGIQPGDIILAVGNTAVNSVADLAQALDVKKHKTVALLIKRGGASSYVPLHLN
ncbi:MAG TPA: DegQ family serine endoprotease [Parasulfuritortus sp.]